MRRALIAMPGHYCSLTSSNKVNEESISWRMMGETKNDRATVMNIEWDYNYYQPWSDNEWLVDEMLAMLDEDIIMQ